MADRLRKIIKEAEVELIAEEGKLDGSGLEQFWLRKAVLVTSTQRVPKSPKHSLLPRFVLERVVIIPLIGQDSQRLIDSRACRTRGSPLEGKSKRFEGEP